MDVYPHLLKTLENPELVEKTLLWCSKNETHIHFPESLSPLLSEISGLPPILFVRGNRDCFKLPALAVVGARKATNYGLACSYRLSRELSALGVCVVSGLARGIDGASHRGALSSGGKTIAVMGSGFAHIYPREHQRLAFEILEQGGSWLSEYPPFEPPLPFHFPKRNRLISGLSLGTLVIEARKKSGSLITALCGLEQGREVFVVPGPIDSDQFSGGHELIQNGAKLVLSVRDILEELPLKLKMNPFPFGQSFTLVEWLEIYGQKGLLLLEEAIKRGQIFETAPQRYLSTKTSDVEESCQMVIS
ncbi:MAG: DNA-processing protein DprA [Pseudomonadota bacterium]